MKRSAIILCVSITVNRLGAGGTYMVNNVLTANGTTCVTIKSGTSSSVAALNSGNCSFDVNFGLITDVRAGRLSQ